MQKDNRNPPDLLAACPSKAAIDGQKHCTSASLQRAENLKVSTTGEPKRRDSGHFRLVCKESGYPARHAFVTYDQLAHG